MDKEIRSLIAAIIAVLANLVTIYQVFLKKESIIKRLNKYEQEAKISWNNNTTQMLQGVNAHDIVGGNKYHMEMQNGKTKIDTVQFVYKDWSRKWQRRPGIIYEFNKQWFDPTYAIEIPRFWEDWATKKIWEWASSPKHAMKIAEDVLGIVEYDPHNPL